MYNLLCVTAVCVTAVCYCYTHAEHVNSDVLIHVQIHIHIILLTCHYTLVF